MASPRHVHWFTHLDAPAADAAATFRTDPGGWLPAPAAVHEEGWLVQLDGAGPLPAALARRLALVSVGVPTGSDGQVLRRLTWQAVSFDRLFPVLDADVELTPLGGGGCQLSLMGTYRSPLAVIGTAAETLLGHRVAEACVRRFVLDVAAHLTSLAPTLVGGAGTTT